MILRSVVLLWTLFFFGVTPPGLFALNDLTLLFTGDTSGKIKPVKL